MRMSYRTRRRLQRFGVAMLILVLALALFAGGYLLWIDRYPVNITLYSTPAA